MEEISSRVHKILWNWWYFWFLKRVWL